MKAFEQQQQRDAGLVAGKEYLQTDNDKDLGRYIGQFDPFRKAYHQPSLRARSHARPEQPFLPAQLGCEDAFFSGGSTGGNTTHEHGSDGNVTKVEQRGYQDSGATVRLRNMNQNDRRLIN